MDSMEMAMDWSIIFVLELLFSWLRRPHPMVAHFPIAFFPAALFSAITAGSGHLLLPPFNSYSWLTEFSRRSRLVPAGGRLRSACKDYWAQD